MAPAPAPDLSVTPDRVAAERAWILDRADVVVPLVNEVRADLGEAFETTVDPVDEAGYEHVVAETFADGDRAVNVAALVAILRGLDVEEDYPGFVVDEWLGRELAATIAGKQPLRLLAEATFHYADIAYHSGESAGMDDLDAALAAGVQTRLPGWTGPRTRAPSALTWSDEPSGRDLTRFAILAPRKPRPASLLPNLLRCSRCCAARPSRASWRSRSPASGLATPSEQAPTRFASLRSAHPRQRAPGRSTGVSRSVERYTGWGFRGCLR